MKIARRKTNGPPEIFLTLQGEGRNMGNPTVFIRASMCNLHCVWCDTNYTWNWEGTPFAHKYEPTRKFKMNEQMIEMSAEEIFNYIKEIAPFPECKTVVMTGGEPLLQQPAWIELMRLMKPHGYYFEVETNGTILPNPEFHELIDQYNTSPKLENSGNDKKLRDRDIVQRFFVEYSDKVWWKYVVTCEEDLKEILELVEKYNIPHDHVFLMPEGWVRKHLNEKRLWVAELCKKYGFRFTDRLHIQLYGKKRAT